MKVDDIRAKYPRPVAYGNNVPGEYCVLGAACLFNGSPEYLTFPAPNEARPYAGISRHEAFSIAEANDSGDFERAWTLLGEALARVQS